MTTKVGKLEEMIQAFEQQVYPNLDAEIEDALRIALLALAQGEYASVQRFAKFVAEMTRK